MKRHADVTVDHAAWARRFRRASGDLHRHVFWPRFWRAPGHLLSLVEAMFSTLDRKDPPLVRVFVDAGLRYDLAARLIASPSPVSCSLDRWIASRIGHRRYCLTLNGLTRWSEDFHLLMQSTFVNPLFAAIGAPPGGADFYAFLGNYGRTPFGIHQDADHSLLLHLGPNVKYAYVWPRETYLKVHGSAAPSFDFSSVRGSANRYSLRPGDFLFIPAGDFHVLDSRRFSVTLGFSIFPTTPTAQLQECAQYCEDLRPASIATALHSARLMLASNGFVTTRPQEAKPQRQGRFRVPPAFPLICGRSGGMIEIFARGRCIRLRPTPGVVKLVHFLNRCDEFQYSDLLNILNRELDPAAALLLIEHLHQVRAFVPSSGPR